MKKYSVFLLLFVSINLFSQTGYKYKSQFIELKVSDSGYFIQTDILNSSVRSAELRSSQQKGLVESYQQISDNQFLIKSDKQNINKQDYYSHLYYRSSPENYVIILPCIILQLKSGYSADNLLKKYSDILSVSETNGSKYILICHLKNSEAILKIVSEIDSRSDVEWCEPNKLSSFGSFNPLYSRQYYLRNTGANGGIAGMDINVEPAWGITNGNENITVAVIDCGVDRNHEDLENRVLEGYTALNPNGGGLPQNANELNPKAHGMACAGIIAAGNNTIGIRGIASNSRVLPINIVPNLAFRHPSDPRIIIEGFADDIEIARAINWAWKRADVLSCSWGGGSPSNDISLAIDSARTFGRNGKGSIVVFASGNNHPRITDVSFPANVDGVITVGAIDNRGTIHDYSQRGVSMDLVAPSGGVPGDVVTTDRMGNLGYNNTNYTNTFNGTSASCPQVAGVAALMLSVRSDLTETEVRTTLQNTARDLGTSGFDHTYGYGLVDAHAALQAVTPRISGPSTVCDQATYTIKNLPAGATVQWNSSGNLTRASAQGAHPCTFAANPPGTSGDGWIEAVLIYQSDSINIPRKILHVGTESPTIHGTEFPAVWRHAVYTVDSPVAEWVITPAEGVITRTRGNKMDAIFRKTGEYRIGARTDNGCGYGPFAYRTANVSDIDSIFGNPEISYYSSAISGPSEICDNVAFSINVPPGATIKWFCEGKVRQVSPQGDNPCVFSAHPSGTSGEGLIGAVVFIQDTPYRVREKNVTIGTPSNISITGNMFPANHEWVTYTALTDNTNLTWNVIPSNGVSMTPYGNQLNVMFTSGGTYQLGVKASNSCGYGTYAYETILVTDSIFRIYPNPAKDMVTVELGISGGKPQQGKQESAGVCEIQLWSAAALIRRYNPTFTYISTQSCPE